MSQCISKAAAVAALVVSLVAVSSTAALAQGGSNPNTNRLDVAVTGDVTTPAGAVVGPIAGTFKISKFVAQDGKMFALGQLNATITDAAGNVRSVVTNVAWPVTGRSAEGLASCDSSATRACDILELVLGPLHLDLLGLVVDLNQVVLTITGTTGSGDLLGNLLCAITGLFDGLSIGSQLANLLNQLVGILAGL
jgi:hypothetical protein